jgi:hypothetical protein
MIPDEEYNTVRKLRNFSWKDDIGAVDHFDNTAFSQPDCPYTPYM